MTADSRQGPADHLRGLFKRMLWRSPLAYDAAKHVFQILKRAGERRIVWARHPGVRLVNYSKRELQRQHQDGFCSQFGQDHYLWHEVLGRRESGFFVEIGANHPTDKSNSYFLERHGWRGISFDPLTAFRDEWRSLRTTPLHNVAIAADDGHQEFVEIQPREGWEHQLSGLAEYVREIDTFEYDKKRYTVATAPLRTFVANEPIDLMMIDVEGAEEAVLAGVDLGTVRPEHLLIENVSTIGGSDQLRSHVESKGYELVARIGMTDDLFRRLA